MFLCLNASAALPLFDRLCLILREIHEKWLLLAGPVQMAAECIAGELTLNCGRLQFVPCHSSCVQQLSFISPETCQRRSTRSR